MNKKSFFSCVVECVVRFLQMRVKPLTTLKFLGDRFVITPPQRCLSGSDYEPVKWCCVVSGLIKLKGELGGMERRRGGKEEKRRKKFEDEKTVREKISNKWLK